MLAVGMTLALQGDWEAVDRGAGTAVVGGLGKAVGCMGLRGP